MSGELQSTMVDACLCRLCDVVQDDRHRAKPFRHRSIQLTRLIRNQLARQPQPATNEPRVARARGGHLEHRTEHNSGRHLETSSQSFYHALVVRQRTKMVIAYDMPAFSEPEGNSRAKCKRQLTSPTVYKLPEIEVGL